MSKLGKLPVAIPAGVTVTVAPGLVTVKGPKGELKQDYTNNVKIEVKENEAVVNGFLSGHHEFLPEDFQVGSRHSEMGMYTFWPNVDGTDGFFAAKLRRKRE